LTEWPGCGAWELIQQVLETLKLTKEKATVRVPGHEKRVNFEAQENSFADETVKQAAITPEVPIFCLIPYLLPSPITPIFTPPEELQLKILGQLGWIISDWREMISRPLMRELLTFSTR
jgi:hypothetical protein